tara:strand:+ start:2910 stop:6569 length:3660 start_codon:yes stop_codon:yes gene_type:complete
MSNIVFSEEELNQLSQEETSPPPGTTLSKDELTLLDNLESAPLDQQRPKYVVNPAYETVGSGRNSQSFIDENTTLQDVFAKYPTNIPLQQIVSSDAFINADADERRKIIYEGINKYNQNVYSGTGEKFGLGDEEGYFQADRKLKTVDRKKLQEIMQSPEYLEAKEQDDIERMIKLEENAQVSYLVPRPDTDDQERGIIQGTLDYVSGAGAKAFREIGAIGENALELIGLNDPEVDNVRKEFPLVMPKGDIENIVTDIGSIMIGGAGGLKLANFLTSKYGMTTKAANESVKKWETIKKTLGIGKGKVDPNNVEQVYNSARKWEQGIRLGLGLQASNLGAAATTPEEVETLVGSNVINYFGGDVDQQNYWGHYIDNVAFTAALSTLVKAGGSAYRAVKSKFSPFGQKPNDKDVAFSVLFDINPELADAPGHVVAAHMEIMGDVLRNNKNFQVILTETSEVTLDTTTAFASGADDYFQRAYGHFETFMDPKDFKEFKKAKTEELVSGFNSLKSTRLADGGVREVTAGINKQTDDLLGTTSDDIATTDEVSNVVVSTAKANLDDVTKGIDDLDSAKSGQEAANKSLAAEKDKNLILQSLENIKNSGQLDDSLATLNTEDLYTGWKESYNTYSKAFDDLPEGIQFNKKEFIEDFNTIFADQNSFDIITSTAAGKFPVVELLKRFKPQKIVDEAGEESLETIDDVVKRLDLDGVDLKQLYNEIRPQISKTIDSLITTNKPATEPLLKLRGLIDELAEESGDDSFEAAMTLFKDHKSIYGADEVLNRWEGSAKKVIDTLDPSGNLKVSTSLGVPKGLDDAYEAGLKGFSQASNAENPQIFRNWLNAVSKGAGQDVTADVSEGLVIMAINELSKSVKAGVDINSQQINQIMAPHLKKIEKINPELAANFRTSIDDLQAVESGVVQADDYYQTTKALAIDNLDRLKQKSISKFLVNISGKIDVIDPKVVQGEEVRGVFKEIFNSNKAFTTVDDLMKEVDASGDPLLREAIQSEYLKFLRSKIYGNKGIGIKQSDLGDFQRINEANPSKLNEILDPNSNQFQLLDKIFENKPELALGIKTLISVQNMAINPQAVRMLSMGSDTLDNLLKFDEKAMLQNVNRLIVMTLGVLNPVATRARNLSAAFLQGKGAEVERATMTLLDNFLIDPQFAEVALKRAAGDAMTFGEPEFKSLITRHGLLGSFTEVKDMEEESQTDQMLRESETDFPDRP